VDIIDTFVAPTGKLEYQELRQYIHSSGFTFAELQYALKHPVLVGRELYEGEFEPVEFGEDEPEMPSAYGQTIRFKLDMNSQTTTTMNQRLIPNIAGEITPEYNVYALRMQPVPEKPHMQQATIGKLSDKDVIIDDMSVSRSHGRIIHDNGDYYVIDDSSTNGSKVSHRDLLPGQAQALLPNSRVSFGRMVFIFTPLRLLYNMLVTATS